MNDALSLVEYDRDNEHAGARYEYCPLTKYMLEAYCCRQMSVGGTYQGTRKACPEMDCHDLPSDVPTQNVLGCHGNLEMPFPGSAELSGEVDLGPKLSLSKSESSAYF